jgi:ABC-type uncharacterized transport system substrate-binding protein
VLSLGRTTPSGRNDQMTACIRRRELITLLGGAAAAWPLAARAQQSAMPVVGFLRSTPSAPFQNLVVAFGQGLKEEGFVEGQNAVVDYRYADNQIDRLPALVAELIHRPVAVIVGDNISAIVARHATMTVPIVFATGGGAVRNGIISRPGANVTGISFFSGGLESKRLELLRQLVPRGATIAMLADPELRRARRNKWRCRPRRKRSGSNSLISMPGATPTSRAPLSRSCNARPARCWLGLLIQAVAD